jgi:RimJ/RimL family protein N-acetyltransferase
MLARHALISTVQLRIHDDPASFLADARGFLLTAEAANSSVMAQMARMISVPAPDDAGAYLACAVDGDAVVATAVLASSDTMQVSSGPEQAFHAIAADVHARRRQPKRIVGPPDACEAFAGAWRRLTGSGHEKRFHLRHFDLSELPAIPAISGVMRGPEPPEYERVAGWICEFIVEAQLPAEDPARVRERFTKRMQRGLIRVWDDGGLVSLAGYGEIPEEGHLGAARIGPVYTPPEHRGRGYASALVAALSRELLAAGRRKLFLTTDLANPISNGIYEKIGYRSRADHFHYDFLPAQAGTAE